VLDHGLAAVESACAEALEAGLASGDVILTLLARRRQPTPPPSIIMLTAEPEKKVVDAVSSAFSDSISDAVKSKTIAKSATQIADEISAMRPDGIPHAGNHTPAAFVGTGSRLRSECMVAFNRNPWPQSPESAI
jgi:hypothetical protein